ncbi:MAG TPA: 2-phospho-L-lactate guanylyltransferase [Hyphomicrobiaceae bacterium]|jgi:2-phospho-L-lactate/phosphoenolpyruvate guanylyltransferase|nr:2-phospho-L-lactate guanylyltransferase [Hyphomicrobiaceae bacterium]
MMPAETWAIIPVKTLERAKQRLAPVLPPPVRRELVVCMLQSVLAAVVAAGGLSRILVVTADPNVALLAEAMAAEVLREDRVRGLNAAVRLGLARAAAAGAARALVLPADVPLVTPGELNCLLGSGASGTGARASLVPAADGDGTNAMLLVPPTALEPAFGPGSYARHLSQAIARRLDVEVLRLPGLAGDIDRPADLARLLSPAPQLAPFQFLARHVMKAARDGVAG